MQFVRLIETRLNGNIDNTYILRVGRVLAHRHIRLADQGSEWLELYHTVKFSWPVKVQSGSSSTTLSHSVGRSRFRVARAVPHCQIQLAGQGSGWLEFYHTVTFSWPIKVQGGSSSTTLSNSVGRSTFRVARALPHCHNQLADQSSN